MATRRPAYDAGDSAHGAAMPDRNCRRTVTCSSLRRWCAGPRLERQERSTMRRIADRPSPATSLGMELHRLLADEHAQLRRAEASNDIFLARASAARIDDLLGLADRNDITLSLPA